MSRHQPEGEQRRKRIALEREPEQHWKRIALERERSARRLYRLKPGQDSPTLDRTNPAWLPDHCRPRSGRYWRRLDSICIRRLKATPPGQVEQREQIGENGS
jgi:hypothetical protein